MDKRRTFNALIQTKMGGFRDLKRTKNTQNTGILGYIIGVQTAARVFGVQTADAHSQLLFYSTIISRNLHVRLLQENPSAIWLSANFSPVHTVSEAPLSSRERLSIIVAALGALKNSNIPLNIGQSGSATGH